MLRYYPALLLVPTNGSLVNASARYECERTTTYSTGNEEVKTSSGVVSFSPYHFTSSTNPAYKPVDMKNLGQGVFEIWDEWGLRSMYR